MKLKILLSILLLIAAWERHNQSETLVYEATGIITKPLDGDTVDIGPGGFFDWEQDPSELVNLPENQAKLRQAVQIEYVMFGLMAGALILLGSVIHGKLADRAGGAAVAGDCPPDGAPEETQSAD